MEFTISLERYTELVKAETKLAVVKELAKRDGYSYGYNENTARGIDAVLGIEREEK